MEAKNSLKCDTCSQIFTEPNFSIHKPFCMLRHNKPLPKVSFALSSTEIERNRAIPRRSDNNVADQTFEGNFEEEHISDQDEIAIEKKEEVKEEEIGLRVRDFDDSPLLKPKLPVFRLHARKKENHKIAQSKMNEKMVFEKMSEESNSLVQDERSDESSTKLPRTRKNKDQNMNSGNRQGVFFQTQISQNRLDDTNSDQDEIPSFELPSNRNQLTFPHSLSRSRLIRNRNTSKSKNSVEPNPNPFTSQQLLSTNMNPNISFRRSPPSLLAFDSQAFNSEDPFFHIPENNFIEPQSKESPPEPSPESHHPDFLLCPLCNQELLMSERRAHRKECPNSRCRSCRQPFPRMLMRAHLNVCQDRNTRRSKADRNRIRRITQDLIELEENIRVDPAQTSGNAEERLPNDGFMDLLWQRMRRRIGRERDQEIFRIMNSSGEDIRVVRRRRSRNLKEEEVLANVELFEYKKIEGAEIENEACPICFEEYKEKEELKKLPCKHFFHKVCVDPWLEMKRNCAVCKKIVKKARRF